MKDLIEMYKGTLTRKENIVNRYHVKKKLGADLLPNEEITCAVLESEIRLIKEFIEELEYKLESK